MPFFYTGPGPVSAGLPWTYISGPTSSTGWEKGQGNCNMEIFLEGDHETSQILNRKIFIYLGDGDLVATDLP